MNILKSYIATIIAVTPLLAMGARTPVSIGVVEEIGTPVTAYEARPKRKPAPTPALSSAAQQKYDQVLADKKAMYQQFRNAARILKRPVLTEKERSLVVEHFDVAAKKAGDLQNSITELKKAFESETK
jgi:hypothetical protein